MENHINQKIQELIGKHFPLDNADLIGEMFSAVVKFGRESPDRGDMKLLNTAIKELRYAFHLFSQYRDVLKVTIFGSARTPENVPQYDIAEAFARKISRKGYMVITGGGGGIMEAGNRGAGPEKSFGVNIRLPFEQKSNEFISEERLINLNIFLPVN